MRALRRAARGLRPLTGRVEPTEEARAAVYSMAGYDDPDFAFGGGGGAAVPLDEFDYGGSNAYRG